MKTVDPLPAPTFSVKCCAPRACCAATPSTRSARARGWMWIASAGTSAGWRRRTRWTS